MSEKLISKESNKSRAYLASVRIWAQRNRLLLKVCAGAFTGITLYHVNQVAPLALPAFSAAMVAGYVAVLYRRNRPLD